MKFASLSNVKDEYEVAFLFRNCRSFHPSDDIWDSPCPVSLIIEDLCADGMERCNFKVRDCEGLFGFYCEKIEMVEQRTEPERQAVIHEGYIIDGYMKGFNVKTLFDVDSGGYYILYSKDFNDKTAEGYDEWYPDIETVNSRLSEMEVKWNDR